MAMTVSRKQRLRTLENRIRKNYESFVQTGQDLKEIRDDRLFEEDGFETWETYLRVRVGEEFGIEKSHVHRLIAASEIRVKLPDLSSSPAGDEAKWSIKAVNEFARLAPKSDGHEQRYDYSKIDKRDAARVAKDAIKRAEEDAKSKGKETVKLTSSHVRAAVDAELGVDRAGKAKETKRRHEVNGIDLEEYLTSKLGQIEAITENLEKVPAESWTLLEDSSPGLATSVAEACDELAALLRS